MSASLQTSAQWIRPTQNLLLATTWCLVWLSLPLSEYSYGKEFTVKIPKEVCVCVCGDTDFQFQKTSSAKEKSD